MFGGAEASAYPRGQQWEHLGKHSSRCLCHGIGPKSSDSYDIEATIAKGASINGKQGARERVASCLRALAFLHRGIKNYHPKWDTYAGDVMLLLAGVSLRSTGQIKVEAERRFWQVAQMFESKYQDWTMCGAAAAEPESHTGVVLCFAEGLVALRWMGVDVRARAGLRSVWDGVRAALSDQIDLVDLIGFDPRLGRLPLTRRGNCNNCTSENEEGRTRCKYCGWVLRVRPQYEDVTDAVVWCYILSELGIEMSCTSAAPAEEREDPVLMEHVLAVYAQIYPYLPLERLGRDLFKQQCYCVTHLLLALSNYGRYRLPGRLFRAELKFLHAELGTVLGMGDPELVGEFVDCLCILGVAEQSLDLVRGRGFLLDLEARAPAGMSLLVRGGCCASMSLL